MCTKKLVLITNIISQNKRTPREKRNYNNGLPHMYTYVYTIYTLYSYASNRKAIPRVIHALSSKNKRSIYPEENIPYVICPKVLPIYMCIRNYF